MTTEERMPDSLCNAAAEEALLSACVIDAQETLSICREAGISASSFHKPAHGALYHVVDAMEREGLEVDLIALMDRLEHTPLSSIPGNEYENGTVLSFIGGAAVFNQIASAAAQQGNLHAKQWAATVTKAAALRAGAQFAQRLEQCFAHPDGRAPADIFSEAIDRLNDLAGNSALDLRRILAERAFDLDNPPPPVDPVFCLGDVPVATAGNLQVISAQPAAGKSSFVAAALAATMSEQGDFLGLSSSNPDGRAVLHLDTEQSLQDYHALIRRACHRAKVRPPDWLHSVWLTGLPPAQIIAALERLMKDAQAAHGGIHSVWLDGVADCVASPNDEEEANGLVTRLHALAIKYACAIFGVIHLNPGSEKTRGHLGSQLTRKCEVELILRKERDKDTGDEVTTVTSTKTRHRPIPDFIAPRFAWSDELKMHVSVATKRDVEIERKHSEYDAIIDAAWGQIPDKPLSHKQLIPLIQDVLDGCSESTAKRRLEAMKDSSLIYNSTVHGGYLPRQQGPKSSATAVNVRFTPPLNLSQNHQRPNEQQLAVVGSDCQ